MADPETAAINKKNNPQTAFTQHPETKHNQQPPMNLTIMVTVNYYSDGIRFRWGGGGNASLTQDICNV